MKNFLEEYGLAILTVIVITLLIAMATPIKNGVSNSMAGVINRFTNKTNTLLETTSSNH